MMYPTRRGPSAPELAEELTHGFTSPVAELITRAWVLSGPELPDPMTVLTGTG